jgi:hypothetical protein
MAGLLKRWLIGCGFPFAVSLCSSAQGAVPDKVCQELRKLYQDTSIRWVALVKDSLVQLHPDGIFPASRLSKIVYLHFRRDQYRGPTILGIKLAYTVTGNLPDKDVVRVQNNFSKSSFSIDLTSYQTFHEGGDNSKLKRNFHLTSGLTRSDIPFDSYDPADRLKEMLFPKLDGERSYRAYLHAYKAMQDEGTCVDFGTYFPDGTSGVEMSIVDLSPDEEGGVFYRAKIVIGVKWDLIS